MAAVCMKTHRFGKSLPGPKAYGYFGYTADTIVATVLNWLEKEGKQAKFLMVSSLSCSGRLISAVECENCWSS
jgi:hypothetical protein